VRAFTLRRNACLPHFAQLAKHPVQCASPFDCAQDRLIDTLHYALHILIGIAAMERERIIAQDSLRQELDSLYLACLDGEIPSALFHYTDAGGLLGIIDTRRLWVTHTFYLNDVTEISYTHGLVGELVEELQKEVKPYAKEKSTYEVAHSMYSGFLQRLRYDTMRIKPNPDVYVVCFCEDDDLLSQWRGYGNRGSGYAIGFDTERLVHPSHAFKLRKVLYHIEEQKQILNKILSAVRDSLFSRLTEVMSFDSAESLAEEYAVIFENEVARYATFFKHKKFQEEKEWRLIYSPTENVYSNQIKFRSGRFGIVPYTEIGLPDGKNNDHGGLLPIVSVRIGPTAQPVLERKALDMLAGGKYPDIEILKSDVPLR